LFPEQTHPTGKKYESSFRKQHKKYSTTVTDYVFNPIPNGQEQKGFGILKRYKLKKV
jgi:hypothetical protein